MRMLVFFTAFVAAATVASAQDAAPAAAADAPCIAIVLPSVQGVEGSATQVAEGLRELLTSYLTGPTLRTITLEARLPSLATEEAKQKGCGHVLTTTFTRKAGGGGGFGRALGRAAGTAAWHMPYGYGAGSAVARGAAVAAAEAVGTVASSTKAKDEMKMDYRLTPLGGSGRPVAKSEKTKAQTDGEDIVTPLVEKAAEGIVTALSRK